MLKITYIYTYGYVNLVYFGSIFFISQLRISKWVFINHYYITIYNYLPKLLKNRFSFDKVVLVGYICIIT